MEIYIYICIYTHLPNPGNEPKSPALEVDSLPSKPPGKPIHSPGGASGKEPTCQSRRYKRCGFNPWVGKIPWRRAWQPTPIFLPGKSHEQRILAGYSPWGCTESDTTEATMFFIYKTYIYIYIYMYVLFLQQICKLGTTIFPPSYR